MRKFEARIAAAETVHTGPDLILAYARPRIDCERIDYGLSQREHTADVDREGPLGASRAATTSCDVGLGVAEPGSSPDRGVLGLRPARPAPQRCHILSRAAPGNTVTLGSIDTTSRPATMSS